MTNVPTRNDFWMRTGMFTSEPQNALIDDWREEFEQKVKKGAKLLDEIRPGWAERINLESLNLMSQCQCVLGQVWAEHERVGILSSSGYHVAIDELVNAQVFEKMGDAEDHGFIHYRRHNNGGAEAWVALDELWVEQIQERLQ